MRIPYLDLVLELKKIFIKRGMTEEDADLSSRLFVDASADGVHSHGLNRFPLFISLIDRGFVDVKAHPVIEDRIGIIERWNGNKGAGNLNAWKATERATEIAHEHGIGIVTLKNTNHWMRAGNYGIEAVNKGCIAILWTNAMPNMPAWGAKKACVGNNPLVLAVPYKETPVIVDIAMSMFSYGKLQKYQIEGKLCPVDGGFDRDGNITRDPSAILETRELLPMGFWKGSGMAIALDLIVSLISGGRTTREIGELECETEVSQMFMAIDLGLFPDKNEMERKIGETLDYIDSSVPRNEGSSVHYPGEGMKKEREDSMRLGVFVDDNVWEKVKDL